MLEQGALLSPGHSARMHAAVVFWIVAALVVAVTLGVLLYALLAHRPATAGAHGADSPPADTASVALFRDQKRQLDDDLANGVIDAAEHARMQDELAQRLGHEVDAAPPAATAAPSPRARWIVAGTLVVLVPITAGALYFTLGKPQAIDPASVAAARKPMTQKDVLSMVDTLAARMKANPEDPRGWALLGRSYAVLGRFDESAAAYAQATQRAPDEPALLADYADSLSMAQGSLQGKPTEIVARALALDPHNQKALALAAASASERQDYDAALDYWRVLAADLPADSDAAREVSDVIADTLRKKAAASDGTAGSASASASTAPSRSAMASRSTASPPAAASSSAMGSASPKGSPPAMGAPAPAGSQSAAASPSAAGSQSAAGSASAAASARVAGTVELSPALAARAQPGDTVFIFARAVDGPRMPLAVLRTTVRELPRAFTLDDSMAMAPGATISGAHSIVIEARISKSGNALPASGDLAGKSSAAPPGSTNIHVLIDTVVP